MEWKNISMGEEYIKLFTTAKDRKNKNKSQKPIFKYCCIKFKKITNTIIKSKSTYCKYCGGKASHTQSL
jgi:hypothetical protein